VEYYRARYYDPHVGRFISEDPIGFRGGVNFFSYADNRPSLLRDPFGLTAWIYCTRCKGEPTGPLDCIMWDTDGNVLPFGANSSNDAAHKYPAFNASGNDPYGKNGPVGPGTYGVNPRADAGSSSRYPNGTPSITGPGESAGNVTTPAGTVRSNLYFHAGPGRTDGCMACDSGAEKQVKDFMDRHQNQGGTWLTISEIDCKCTK
jgi:uncharacterized protein RhaS with RHS repeats